MIRAAHLRIAASLGWSFPARSFVHAATWALMLAMGLAVPLVAQESNSQDDKAASTKPQPLRESQQTAVGAIEQRAAMLCDVNQHFWRFA